MRQFHKDGTDPSDGQVFVFGSNLAGRHGMGAALAAVRKYGAVYGRGHGRQGMSYAIPTKDGKLNVFPLARIRSAVATFAAHVITHPDERFFITRIGCGLAGYEDKDIAPMFKSMPDNCSFAEEWKDYV